jgi:hypothetical protein
MQSGGSRSRRSHRCRIKMMQLGNTAAQACALPFVIVHLQVLILLPQGSQLLNVEHLKSKAFSCKKSIFVLSVFLYVYVHCKKN